MANSTTKWVSILSPELGMIWDDLSYQKEMRCKNHPDNLFYSKNPWIRSIFVRTTDCNCPIADLEVTSE